MVINTIEAPLWTSINHVPAQYPWLDEDIRCEVAVVGSGISAAMCALHFAQAGIDTVMLGDGPLGHGGTAVSSGMMGIDGEESLGDLVGEIGADRAMMAADLLKQSMDQVEQLCSRFEGQCGFKRMDSLRFTTESGALGHTRQEYSLRLHNGMDVELLTPEAASRQFTFPMESGVYTKNVAAQVDPFRLVHAVAAEAKKNGARIYENTAVNTVMEEENNGCTLHCSTLHEIHAEYVIIAAGLDTARQCGGLEHVTTTYMVATEPVADFAGWRGPCVIHRDGGQRLYLTVTPDSRLLIGGLDSSIMDERGRVAGMIDLSSKARKRYENLTEILKEMFPAIRDITARFVFAAKDGRTEDRLPVIGRLPESSSIAYALCCGDNGILYSELAGRLLLDQYRGEGSRELGLFSPGREWRVKQ